MAWSWTLLRAGAFMLDGGAMFGIVPKPLWSRLVAPDEKNRIPLNTNCLLLREAGDRGRTVLVETGIGDKFDDKKRAIYAMEERWVADALREQGVAPERIDAVIVTHLHFDHAGALTRRGPGGAPVPTFPRATIHTQKQEWEDALANKATMHSTYLRDHLDPVREQVRVFEGEGEPIPGVRVAPLPGHTWGQQGVWFEDDKGRTVVFPADLMPTINHVALTHGMAYDVLPYETLVQKGAFLRRAAAAQWLIALDHEPGPALVRAEESHDKPGQHRLVPVNE